MTRFWRGALAIGTAIVVPLGFYAYFSVRLLSQICYNIHSFKIKNISGGTIDLIVTLAVKNPSNINIKIEGYTMDVKINGQEVAKINNNREKILESGATSLLDIPISLSYDKFLTKVKWDEILGYFLTGKTDKIFVNLDGRFLGAVAKIPVSTGVKLDYSVAEIMQMLKEPSKPCVTGKVKRSKEKI